MRIEPKTVAPVTTSEPRTAAGSAPAKTEGKGASVVTLSTAANAAVAGSPPTDPAIALRIQAIRAQLRNSYPIDLDKLASRIVDDEIERGGKR